MQTGLQEFLAYKSALFVPLHISPIRNGLMHERKEAAALQSESDSAQILRMFFCHLTSHIFARESL